MDPMSTLAACRVRRSGWKQIRLKSLVHEKEWKSNMKPSKQKEILQRFHLPQLRGIEAASSVNSQSSTTRNMLSEPLQKWFYALQIPPGVSYSNRINCPIHGCWSKLWKSNTWWSLLQVRVGSTLQKRPEETREKDFSHSRPVLPSWTTSWVRPSLLAGMPGMLPPKMSKS